MAGTVLYTAGMLTLFGLQVAQYPGFSTEEAYAQWMSSIGYALTEATYTLYVCFALLSTIVTFGATLRLIRFVKSLTGSRRDVGFNQRVIVVHLSVLVSEVVCVIFQSIAWLISDRALVKVSKFCSLAFVMLLQLAICYICFTQGSCA